MIDSSLRDASFLWEEGVSRNPLTPALDPPSPTKEGHRGIFTFTTTTTIQTDCLSSFSFLS